MTDPDVFITQSEQTLTAICLKTGEELTFGPGTEVVVCRTFDEVNDKITVIAIHEARVNGIPVQPDSLKITEPSYEVWDPSDGECDCDGPIEDCTCGSIPSRSDLYDRIQQLKNQLEDTQAQLNFYRQNP